MKICNLSFEFEIIPIEFEAGVHFTLKKTRRDFFKIDSQKINQNGIRGTHFVSHSDSKSILEILEGEFYNQFSFDFPNSIKKNTYLIYKNKVLVGLCENHIQYFNDMNRPVSTRHFLAC